MAFRINCGKPEQNEVAALNWLAAELSDDWALFTNTPRHLTGSGPKGREIDALALSPHGAVVIELKHFGGLITVNPAGEWFVAGKLLTDRKGNPQFPVQQAGKAAQVLKTALGSAAGSVYIEACAVATRPSATIRFADPSRAQAIMPMEQAAAGIEALARRTRGVSYPALQAFFNLVGHGIPPNLVSSWRETIAARSTRTSHDRGRHARQRPTGDFRRSPQDQGVKSGALPIGWIATALLVGSVGGLALLKLLGSG